MFCMQFHLISERAVQSLFGSLETDMSSIVIELQRDALDRSVAITDLLRKALVVARKLKQQEFLSWIESELSGYRGDIDIPEYRELFGQVKGWNPYNGWIPVIINDAEFMEKLSTQSTGQSISEIESILDQGGSDSILHMPFSPGQQQALRGLVNNDTEFTLFVPLSRLSNIVDSVRNAILNWALELEDNGILGDGLSFSESEKEAAASHSYNINNFFGDVSGSNLQQASGHASRQYIEADLDVGKIENVVRLIKGSLNNLDVGEEVKSEIGSDLQTIEVQLNSPKPKPPIIKESLKSIRAVLEGAGGGAAAQVLLEIGKVLL